jgi:hypothetical protein
VLHGKAILGSEDVVCMLRCVPGKAVLEHMTKCHFRNATLSCVSANSPRQEVRVCCPAVVRSSRFLFISDWTEKQEGGTNRTLRVAQQFIYVRWSTRIRSAVCVRKEESIVRRTRF